MRLSSPPKKQNKNRVRIMCPKRKGVKNMKKFQFNGIIHNTITEAQNAAYLFALDTYGATDDFDINPFYDPHYYKPLSKEEDEYHDSDLNNLIDFFFGLIVEIDTPVVTTNVA